MMFEKFYGYIAWFVTTLFVIYAFCLNTAAAIFAEPIKSSLHLGNFEVALATGSFILGFAFMQIPAGYLLDRFNARYVLSGGVFLLALGNTLIYFSDHFITFTAANFLQGIGASFAFVGVAVLISQWFPAKFFPILFGLTQTFSCILAGAIHYYLTLMLQTHSWNEIYKNLAFTGFALFVLIFLLVKTPSGFLFSKSMSLKNSLAQVIKNKQLWLCTFATASSFGILLAYASFWYLPIQKFYSVTNLQAVFISAMIFLGIGVGTPLLGWFSNYLKSRITVIHLSLTLGTMVLLLGIYLPHFQMNTLIIIKIISFLIGFFLSGAMLFYTMISELSSNAIRGVALSLLNTCVFLTNTLMMFIPYLFITQLSPEFFTYLWILPFCVMLSILLLGFIKDSYPQQEQQ